MKFVSPVTFPIVNHVVATMYALLAQIIWPSTPKETNVWLVLFLTVLNVPVTMSVLLATVGSLSTKQAVVLIVPV